MQAAAHIVMQVLFIFRLMAEDKVHDRFRVFEAVRMVVHARFDNHFNRSAQCQVTGTDYVHIVFKRNSFVAISANADDRDTCFSQWFQVVNRVAFE